MKLTKIAYATASLGLMAVVVYGNANADDADWYVGGAVGQTRANIDDTRISNGLLNGGLLMTSIVDRDRDSGYKIFGGYQLNKNLSIEAGYFDLGKFGFTANSQPPGTLDGNIKLRGVNLDLLGSLPIAGNFSLLGRGGVTYVQTRDNFYGSGAVAVPFANPSKNATNYKLGLGLQYAFTDALALRTEIERHRVDDGVGNRGHIDLVSLSLVYHFGKAAPVVLVRPIAYAPQPREEARMPVPSPAPVVTPAPQPRFEKYTLSATELFEFNSAKLLLPQVKLDEIATAMRNDNTIDHVLISGNTDRIGTVKYNQNLSERRANAVKAYLVNSGIDTNRLTTIGNGSTKPLVFCNDKKRSDLILCLAPNRRVEVENVTVVRVVK